MDLLGQRGGGLILNLCWICFCDFNCHLATFVRILNGLPQGDNLSCSPVKECKEVTGTHFPAQGLPFLWHVCKDWLVFLLCFLTSPNFSSIKEPGNQALTRWLFWGTSLPSWSPGSRIKFLPYPNTSSGIHWLTLQPTEQAPSGRWGFGTQAWLESLSKRFGVWPEMRSWEGQGEGRVRITLTGASSILVRQKSEFGSVFSFLLWIGWELGWG